MSSQSFSAYIESLYDILKAYKHIRGAFLPLDINTLKDMVVRQCELSHIEIRMDSIRDKKELKGAATLARYKDHAIINVIPYNVCWNRFAVAKELVQLVIDLPCSYVDTPEGFDVVMKSFLSAAAFVEQSHKPSVANEHIAILLAVELLMPTPLLDTYIKHYLFDNNNFLPSSGNIARAFRIPEKYCEARIVSNKSLVENLGFPEIESLSMGVSSPPTQPK